MSIEILHKLTGKVVLSFPFDTLRGADLNGANLGGANLGVANLSGANLSEADLSEANLRGANLGGANLRGANLGGADLSEANLRGADLSGASAQTAMGDWLRIAGTRHALHALDEDNISIGCMRNTLAWWREHFRECGHENGYTLEQIEEYRMHIEYAAQWLAARKPKEAK